MQDFGLHDHGVLEKNLNGFMAHIGESAFGSHDCLNSLVKTADADALTGIRFLLVPLPPTDATQAGNGAVLMPISAK